MDFSFGNDNNYIRQFERIIQTQNDNSNSSSCAATSLSEGNGGSSAGSGGGGNASTLSNLSASATTAISNVLNRNGTLSALSGNTLSGNTLAGSLLNSVGQTLVVVGAVAQNGLSSITNSGKKRRPQLSPEQRELINSKRRVSSLTPIQREVRNAKRRVTHLSAEQRERINSKRRVSSLTPEQRELRNAKRRIAALTPAQRELRNRKRRNASHSGVTRKRGGGGAGTGTGTGGSTSGNGSGTRGRSQNNIVNNSLANLTQQVSNLGGSVSSLVGVNMGVVTPGQLTNGGNPTLNGSDLTLADMLSIHHQQQQQQHLNTHPTTIHVASDPTSGLSNLASTLGVAAAAGNRSGSIIALSETGQQLHMINPGSGHKYVIKNEQLSGNSTGSGTSGSGTSGMHAQNIQTTGLIFATASEANLSYIRGDLFNSKLAPYAQQEMNAIRSNTILNTIRKC